MAYGTTLKRYLFCPACPQDTTDFYTFIREDTDPLIVRDLHELVLSWRDIVTGRVTSRGFPCTDCPEQTACYGKTALSDTRIIPFNFYPSYILAFEAGSISAVDFLPLISGASIDEIIPSIKDRKQYGRLDCLLEWQQTHGAGDLFLYNGKAEQFLEILYLKLSFLGDIARIILTPDATPIPFDIASAIDCIWVDLPKYNNLLPCFWNFKLNMYTMGSRKAGTGSLPISHPSQTGYCLGIIWFFALLRNKNQSVQMIKEMLKQIAERPAGSLSAREFPMLAPENNYWNPDACRPEDIPEKWRVIWAQAVSLGARLFLGSYPEKVDNGENDFFTDLERIRQDIKQNLFFKEKETRASLSKHEADVEIHRILSRLSAQWQTNTKSFPAPPHIKEETLTETVILSANSEIGLPKNVQTTVDRIEQTTEEEILETVILKKNAAPPAPAGTLPDTYPPGGSKTIDQKNDMPETLILKPSYTKNKDQKI